MAPPSSGGICLGQIMKMIEPFNVGDYKHNSMELFKLLWKLKEDLMLTEAYTLVILTL